MMTEGLLWYDDSELDLAEKVEQAARRYERKFGESPSVCYVNPSLLPEGECRVGDVSVEPLDTVLLHHFWIMLGSLNGEI